MHEGRGIGKADPSRAPLQGVSPAAARDVIDQHRIAFDDSPTGLLVTSFETGRYVEANAALCDMIGYSREEILATDPYSFWVQVTHPDDFEDERQMLQRLVEGELNGYTGYKKRYLRRDGEVRHVEITVSCVRDERGRIRYCVTQIVDRSENQRLIEAKAELEARLHQSQKLETVGRLVGGVAHDFNNRLLVIMGHAELLKRSAPEASPLQNHASIVLSSARRAAELTRQLLAYGRLQVLNPRSLDLNRVVDACRAMLERLIGDQVELVTVLAAKLPTFADAGQVEQVLLNLVLNARDAMPGGGRLTVETADVLLGDGEAADLVSGDYVALSVADTGSGISPEARGHLFEPFFTTKEIGKGTGLGLATVDGIVRQSGGAIVVRSVEGRGSMFVVYLPRAAEAAVDAGTPAAPHVAEISGVETVLVVDDEEEVRRLLVDVLRLGAYEVLEACNGEHALEVAARHGGSLDLLVTDTVMPKLTGPDLADRLRAREPDLKVLFMSGYAESDRVRALAKNERFIAKPFLPADLFVSVSEFLREGSGRRIDRAG
jgi:PAS domain S-box-containing protein